MRNRSILAGLSAGLLSASVGAKFFDWSLEAGVLGAAVVSLVLAFMPARKEHEGD